MKRVKKYIILVLIIFLVGGNASRADEKKKKTPLEALTEPVRMILAPVKGGDLADLITLPAKVLTQPVFSLGDVVMTPARTREYVFNINKNTRVITKEEIERSNIQSLQQLLSYEPGIVVSGFLGNVKDNNIDIRGFGEAGAMNYLLMIDGRRANQIDLSGADLSQIDTRSIERVEIIRGSGSVLYGDNATGGVINIITKKGKKDTFELEYTQEVGSYQYSKEYLSSSGGSDFLDYFVSFSLQDSDGYRLNNAYEANDFFGSVTMRPDSYLEVDFSSSYHRDWYGQPGALYPANIQMDGRDASRFPNSKAKTEDYYFTLVPKVFGSTTNHDGVLSSLFSYRSRRTNSRNVSFNVYEANHHIVSFDMKPKVEVASKFFDESLENKLVSGIDYFYAKDQILSGDITLTKQQYDIIKETFGLYASDTALISNRFILSGGVRGEWARYIFDQKTPAMSYTTKQLREAAFETGLGVKYNENSQIYANYSRSYRFPATDEFFSSAYEFMNWFGVIMVVPASLNGALKQQVANNVEIGIKDRTFDPLIVNVDYYLIDNKNEIYYDPITYMNTNYHHTVHHGLELEAVYTLIEKIKGFFNLNFQKSFFVGGKFAGNTIPLVPRVKISGGAEVDLGYGLSTNIVANYVGSRYVISDQANTVPKLKAYTTVDWGFAFDIEGARFFLEVRNIFNKKYFLSATKDWQGNAALYPAPERNIQGGVTVRF